MKSRPAFLLLLLLLLPGFALAVTPDPAAAWRAADDARVAAMLSASPTQLDAVFSDELLYVHSNGAADTKASFIAALTGGKTQYRSIIYEQRDFREVVPGLVLVNGRCRVVVGSKEPFNDLQLSFLAAYRLERGVWRFLAWQSCRLPPPAAARP